MCEKCDQRKIELEKEAIRLAEVLAKHLTDEKAGNEVVFLAASKLVMASVLAMKMPPDVFLPIMCEFYSNATGLDVVPIQVSPPQDLANHASDDPKAKPN